jgi:hypothetical protein
VGKAGDMDRSEWKPKRIIFSVLWIALGLFVLTYVAVRCYFPSRLGNPKDDELYVWLQMILAASAPSWTWFRENFNPFWFSVSLTAHVLLNVGTFFGMVWFAVDAAIRRGTVMKLANAVGVRDTLLKAAMLEAVLPQLSSDQAKKELGKTLDEAFASASTDWEEYLTLTMGEKTAKEVMGMLNHSI